MNSQFGSHRNQTQSPKVRARRTQKDTVNVDSKVGRREWAEVKRWLWLAFFIRLILMLVIHVTEADYELRLTRDGFLYEQVGRDMAEYFRTQGVSPWPSRVESVLDSFYEWQTGIVFYLTGDSVLVMKLSNVIVGSLIPLVVWQTARLIFNARVSQLALIATVFFPTQVYYSTLMVRDTQSTMAMSLIFLGLTAVASRGSFAQITALPAGLLIIAGLRTYMFSLLAILIPAGWAAAFLLVRSREKSRVVARVTLISCVCVMCFAGIGLESLYSGNEGDQIADLDFLNKIRRKMNRGGGAMFSGSDIPEIGHGLLDTVTAFGVGIYYFVFSVNPMKMDSIRQFMALPEVLLIIFCIPAMFRGAKRALRYHLFPLIVPLLIALAVTFAYSGVATNGGPLMRWRMQTINAYVLVAALGWSKRRYVPDRAATLKSQSTRPRPYS